MKSTGCRQRVKRIGLVLITAGCLGWSSVPTWSQSATPALQTAGIVKLAVGITSVTRGGTPQPVQLGSAVQVGDTLRTGPDGAIGITLTDDTLITIGANSELVLSDYSFDTTTHEGSMLASLWRGTAAFVTGLIRKKSPEKVRVQTRTVVLGVRGTEFIVDAQKGTP